MWLSVCKSNNNGDNYAPNHARQNALIGYGLDYGTCALKGIKGTYVLSGPGHEQLRQA